MEEVIQTKRDGQPNTMWKTKPAMMAIKVCSARALRDLFNTEEAAEFTYRIKPRKVITTHYTDMAGESEIGEIFKCATQKLVHNIEIEVML